MQSAWGIDLGGTKIEGVVLPDTHSTQPLSRLRINTEAHKGYQHIIAQIVQLVDLLKKDSANIPASIGFGTPGTLDPSTQLLKNSNTVCLNGMPLKKDLENALQLPVIIANDANCFALAETKLGAVTQLKKQPEIVFGVIMGTGVGGGLVVNGIVINGAQGIAGEWGHNFLDKSGGKCYCGKIGCVETVISGPAFQRYYTSLSGEKISMKEIMQRYNKKEVDAIKTIERLLDFFGKAISVVINIIDPEVIILGGGLANIDLLYTKGKEAIRQYVFNNRLDTVLLKPTLGDSAGVFGAAMLAGSE